VLLKKLLAPPVFFGSLVALGFVLLFSIPAPAPAEDISRDKQIADIERQIAELTKKLTELKAAPYIKEAENGTDWVKALHWRCIGPASMGGRVTSIAVYEADPSTYWIATASGGILKTTNNGTTFEHQFDHENTVSVGSMCVAPSDPSIVWVGTGEGNPRNSVSYGDGVYKSVDGGKHWENMGLKKSFQIGKILIHPRDPNTVYVGTLGRLYGPSSDDRGLFKTTDGGKSWQRILYVDDKTGVIDMRMQPDAPDTLLVAMWERQRDEFDSHRGEPALVDGYDAYDPIKKWGPGSGLHKTTDGGKSFRKLTNGLPTSPLGRVGLDFYQKDPKTVYAIIDCQNIGMGPPPKQIYLGVSGDDLPDNGGVKVTEIVEETAAVKAGLKVGDVLKALDKKPLANTFAWMEAVREKNEGDKVTLTVQRGNDTIEVPATLGIRDIDSPGANAKRPYTFLYGGQHENEQRWQGPNGFEYGGVYKSNDCGESWTRVNSVNPRPMYFSQIRVDPNDDKYLYVCGVRMYRSSDNGKKFTNDAARGVHDDTHALWIDPRDGRHMIVGCDGGFYVSYDRTETWDFLNHMAFGQFYHVAVDNKRPYHVYGGLQDNGSWGGPTISMSARGPINEDWMEVGGGDGFVCRVDASDPDVVYFESQDGAIQRRNLRTGEQGSARPRPEQGGPAYRFNWNTPFILSAQNPKIFYSAGNHVFRSIKQGEALRAISPEISRTKRGTGTALAESPRNPEVLWVGTDDGYLWMSRDGGAKWTNVTAKVGLPGFRWVASIEASRYADGRAYVTFDGHRSNDDEPYVYVTEDYGDTWKPLRGNLPTGSTRVLREDIENQNLLYLGTEFAAWASLDRGQKWVKINNNLPTVAVHEFAQPTGGVDEIVIATHGRSIWVLDVAALRGLTPEVLKEDVHLFRPATAVRWRNEPPRGSIYGIGNRKYFGENPPTGAQIYFTLAKKPQSVSLKIVDFTGATVRELQPKPDVGLMHVTWDMRRTPPVVQAGEDVPAGGGGRGGGGRGAGGGGRGAGGAGGGQPGGAGGGQPGGAGGQPGGAGGQPGGAGGQPGGGRGAGGGGGRGFGGGPAAPPGMYRVVLTVDGKEYVQSLKLEGDPNLPVPFVTEDDDDDGK
jgi:photosystem II stability/assembly factor-like uncharacterized protein